MKQLHGLNWHRLACLWITIIMKELRGLILCPPGRLAGASRNAHCGAPLGMQDFLRNSRKIWKKLGKNFGRLQSHNCNGQILYQLRNSRLTNAQIGYIMKLDTKE